ncbi:MAG: filamentous hemagglutinin N-terminal domain-containing protein, partial [Cyanobacteria bacterium P01_A01_bin.83]
EASIVTPNVVVEDAIADYLEGGAIRGNNLFHSFAEFSIPQQDRVYFASPAGIDNILTRVTGDNISQIFGTLGVDGAANLFLLNPNGIVFGQDAQLDIAGSFLATTADSYIWADGFNFSATDPEPPLLTLNIPVGLQFGSNPGSIINRSRSMPTSPPEVSDPENFIPPEGLRIAEGQTLSFLGGEIRLEGGYLNTSGGKIELGAVGADNIVKFSPNDNNWQADYEDVNNFADLKINQHGGIDGGQIGGTQISLTGRNISMGYDLDTLAQLDYQIEDFFNLESSPNLDQLTPDRTRIEAQNHNHPIPTLIEINAADTFSIIDPGRNSAIIDPSRNSRNIVAHTSGTGDAGVIDIVADSIIIYGASVESWTLAGASGNGGEINFTAQNMSLNNAGAGVNTFSQADGGIINLNIAQNVQLKSGGFGATARDEGKGGVIQIKAQNLDIKSGGFGTSTFGNGDAGVIDLDISDSLRVTSGGFGSDAAADGNGGTIQIDARNIELNEAGMGVRTIGGGQGGEIEINAETIMLQDGVISAESGENFDERIFVNENLSTPIGDKDAGNGGSISITAQDLLIDNGNITTSTFGTGEAGNITLEVDSVTAIGGDLITGVNSSTKGSGRGGDITIIGDRLSLQQNAGIAANSEAGGIAGDIFIQAQELIQLQGGIISVDGGTLGSPGNINLDSATITLDQAGTISATTNRGKQGNINLTANSLWLRDRSTIVTNATGGATGGNIKIDLTSNLLALDNSQINASAQQGQGGNIKINATGIFVAPNSKINASSQFGIDGLIQINTLAVAPDSGLISLPSTITDPSEYLSPSCSVHQDSYFTNVGQGGIPANPLQDLIDNTILPDWNQAMTAFEGASIQGSSSQLPQPNSIVEAQTWKINPQGNVELIASSTDNNWNRLFLHECLGNQENY